jgi:molybdate transport system ATP-binding protein
LPVQRTRRRSRFLRVDLHAVRLSLDGRQVLRGVDWSIRPSQRWLLVGANGAGKTQLMKLIAGDVWPTPSRSGRRIYRLGACSFPEPQYIQSEIAYVGAERQDRYERYAWNYRVESVVGTGLHRTDIPLDPLSGADRKRIAALLRRLRIELLARRRFLTLSYGERRLVLLARALAWKPKLLLLDELFNGLDFANRQRVDHCLRVLSRSSLPWVLSTHRAEDIPSYATHVCELRGGRVVSQRTLRKRSRRVSVQGNQHRSTAPVESSERAETLIELRGATVWRDGVAVLRNLSLDIRRGDRWVVHGANGSGKSSLLQLLYGDLGVAQGGSIVRAGIRSGVPLEQFKRRVGLVAPELQAIHPGYLSVNEVVASGQRASIGLNETMDVDQDERIRRALREVGAATLGKRAIRTLSYGQLRRVLFARALAHGPDMLLLDEPYAGVDATTRTSLRSLVRRAQESGVTTVMVTHHREEWPSATSHELELCLSRVVYAGKVRE